MSATPTGFTNIPAPNVMGFHTMLTQLEGVTVLVQPRVSREVLLRSNVFVCYKLSYCYLDSYSNNQRSYFADSVN